MRRRAITAATCALCLGMSAHAADETGKWYVNPQFGYTWADAERNVDDDFHVGLGLGKHLSKHWSLEINGLAAEFESPGALKLDQLAFSLDALYVFRRTARVEPYLTFGAGYLHNDYVGGDNFTGPFAQVGAGVLIDLAENAKKTFVLQLRSEAKLRYDWADTPQQDNFQDSLVTLGIVLNYGPAPYQAPPPAPPPPPLYVAPPPPPPTDSDGDGVLDPADQCPGTPRGAAVDAIGCPRKGAVTLHGVTFEYNAAILTATSLPILNELAVDLKAHPRLKVELQGHTDSAGSDAYNLKLSQERADSVLQYLLKQGVGVSQLTAKGYGETQPIADNNTEAGRAANRRVVMSIADNPGEVAVKVD